MKYVINLMNTHKYELFGQTLFIKEKEIFKPWFIYHPTEKGYFIVGDTLDPYNSNEYRFIEKSVIMNEKIYVYKKDE